LFAAPAQIQAPMVSSHAVRRGIGPFILHPPWRRVLEHPLEDRFDQNGFQTALSDAGFLVQQSRGLWKHFAWFIADKPTAPATS
jgi:hypothetical protein